MTTLKRYEGGRIKGGCSLHDAEKPELCQKHLHRCPEPRTAEFRAADMSKARLGWWRAVEHGFEDGKTPNV